MAIGGIGTTGYTVGQKQDGWKGIQQEEFCRGDRKNCKC